MNTKSKTLAAVLAVLMLLSALPFSVSAADPIALTTSNVTEWPTTSFINGEAMYFGQSVGEAVTLSGGKVEYDGVEVAGHFEFIDTSETPTLVGTQRSNIKFVPDNTDEYTGFESTRNRNVTYVVSHTTPIFADEENDPLVASEVEAGATLSTSTLSGGKMANPYNSEETKILAGSWSWVSSNTIVNESGYYEAQFIANGYELTKKQVYVKIAGEIPETTISEMPTIDDFSYDSSLTWKDVTINGGVAVLKVEGTAVEGTFAVSEQYINYTPSVGSYNIPVTFTPADPEAALPYTFDVPVTVNKGKMKFVDENGNEIVPEITVEYGTKFTDIARLLNPYIKGPDYANYIMGDLEYKTCEEGTYTITVEAPSDKEHYEDTDLTFKIVIEKKKLNPKLTVAVGSSGMIIRDSSGNYSPKGTFTLEYTIDGVAQQPITGIKYETAFAFNHTKSGNYVYTIIYNEAEVDEYFIIDDFTTSNTVTLSWNLKATGTVDTQYKCGETVTVTAPATDPEKKDKPYYGFTGWTDANGNTGLTDEQLKNAEVTFTMPDGAVELTANYQFSFLMLLQYIANVIVNFFTSFFNSLGTLF